MVTILSRLLRLEQMQPDRRRGMYGMLCGIVGIFLNILLFAGKLFAGTVGGSIAITADAFNNLSDAGSSLVSLIGFKLAGQKPDSNHPYGHGRIEYVAGLIVSAIILVMGVELIQSSIDKIIHPTEVAFSALMAGVLIGSICVKCYMAFYNIRVGKRIRSVTMRATAMDSLSDCVATSVVLITAVIAHFTGWKLDGYGGVMVGCFICYTGIQAAGDTLSPLLGEAPDPEFVEQIRELVLTFDSHIYGLHDLMIHDYGPQRKMISLHAEVPADGDFVKMHEVIDDLETALAQQFNCTATIHMDPVFIKDEHICDLKKQVQDIITEMDARFSMHDFRLVSGEDETKILFDLVLPYKYVDKDEDVVTKTKQLIRQRINEDYLVLIHIDKADFK